MSFLFNPLVNSDAYKLSHYGFMDPDTQFIYSNLTARSSKHSPVDTNSVIFFGLQYFIKDYLIDEWNKNFFSRPKDEVISEFKKLVDNYLGKDSVSMHHFEDLHDLGHLPIEIRALKEGSEVPIKVPMLTINNTDEEYAWLTNYLETVLSAELWKPITVATIINKYRKMINEFSDLTTDNPDNPATNFQVHGFEFRGMSGRYDAAICAAAFLLSSYGTDTFPAIPLIESFYNGNSDKGLIAASVPATEHSITSLGISTNGELESMREWITINYPKGIVSIVADTLDFFKVITDYAKELKDDILTRDGKVVFRPDSGYPPEIIGGVPMFIVEDGYDVYTTVKMSSDNHKYVRIGDKKYEYGFTDGGEGIELFNESAVTPEDKGAIECLWELFGGTINDKGFKELNPKVGLIYGDSMTPEIAKITLQRLMDKGFASTNVVFGVGSYTSQYLTRDTLGMAIKATAAKYKDQWIELYKDPKTDPGKRSARGLISVEVSTDGLVMKDRLSINDYLDSIHDGTNQLELVFKDGELFRDQSFDDIRRLVGVIR